MKIKDLIDPKKIITDATLDHSDMDGKAPEYYMTGEGMAPTDPMTGGEMAAVDHIIAPTNPTTEGEMAAVDHIHIHTTDHTKKDEIAPKHYFMEDDSAPQDHNIEDSIALKDYIMENLELQQLFAHLKKIAVNTRYLNEIKKVEGKSDYSPVQPFILQ